MCSVWLSWRWWGPRRNCALPRRVSSLPLAPEFMRPLATGEWDEPSTTFSHIRRVLVADDFPPEVSAGARGNEKNRLWLFEHRLDGDRGLDGKRGRRLR